jgi:AraC-like DNA-binding protein
MAVVGRGRIAVWQGAALWLVEGGGSPADVAPHAHHAIQVTFSLNGAFEIAAGDRTLLGPIALVAADAPHTFHGRGTAAFLFIEPESPAGRALTRQLGGAAVISPNCAVFGDTRAALQLCWTNDSPASDLERIGRALLDRLPSPDPASLPDPRAASMIDYARKGIEGPLSLAAAASQACLSRDRARHVFVAATGLPFKTFVLWLRIERAVSLYASGASLTEAAHEAGFADSAHLSRTFRRTFGLPANALRLTAG